MPIRKVKYHYLNAIAANIEITQYIDDDLVIDYDEEVEEQSSSNNDRRSAESLPEIENVGTLLAKTSLSCEHDQQIDTSAYLRELEEEGEADILINKTE